VQYSTLLTIYREHAGNADPEVPSTQPITLASEVRPDTPPPDNTNNPEAFDEISSDEDSEDDAAGMADEADELEGLEVVDETDFEGLETDRDDRYTARAKGKGRATRIERPAAPADGFKTNQEGRYTARAKCKGRATN
jgi:hypothetical protein